MRRLWAPLATLVLVVPAVLGAGSGTADHTADRTGGGTAAGTPTAPAAPAERRYVAGPTGETISLRGDLPGELLDVTLLAVADPAAPRDAAATPAPDGRLVAVEFRLENTGTAAYADAPRSGSYLLDTGGERYSGVAVATTAGAGFPDGRSLAPGASSTGWVTFQLPEDARPTAVQFALNSGSADDIGQWNLS
ncbi:DUF4352 domain-containing protein [Streptomyces sp. NPDC002138]|uniref:DUF4352 domain-containing protein n=1 Tax=Streptomyces sp. NPDC002138 TaxID=3154410 RepID=UPI003331DAC1